MPFEALISLITIAFAGGITPGPNNALLANSGATFGFKKTINHILGVVGGHAVMIFCIALGLGALFERSPLLQTILQGVSVGLLCWLAYKIGTSGGLSSAKGKARPFKFIEAAAFQWINPKAWAVSISVVAQFVNPSTPLISSLILAVVFGVMGLICTSVWAGLGQALRHWLKIGHRLIWFNRIMAVAILLSVGLLFLEP